MWCPAFAPLREGLDVNNDEDIVHYFQQVFRLREDLNSEELEDSLNLAVVNYSCTGTQTFQPSLEGKQ